MAEKPELHARDHRVALNAGGDWASGGADPIGGLAAALNALAVGHSRLFVAARTVNSGFIAVTDAIANSYGPDWSDGFTSTDGNAVGVSVTSNAGAPYARVNLPAGKHLIVWHGLVYGAGQFGEIFLSGVGDSGTTSVILLRLQPYAASFGGGGQRAGTYVLFSDSGSPASFNTLVGDVGAGSVTETVGKLLVLQFT